SQTCWFNPACVVRPDSATGVSKIIKIVAFLHVEFAVRSGGHSPNPGWSSIDSGILIDLGRLNRTTVTSSQEVAQVGPGAKWSDVIEYLDPYSLTVLGGRVPSVGVGGLILGVGGVSHFTAEYGLVADTLKNVEVVLADGTIVNANPNQNADLFWALKGGGPNFGIVTRFDLATVPINNLWFQSTTHAPDQATAILEAFAEWQNNDDPKGSTIIVITNTFCNIGLVYSAPVELPPCFRPFYDIPVLQTAVPSIKASVLNLSNIIAAASPPTPIRHDYRGASSKVDIQLYKEVHAFWAAKTAEVSAATGANMTFVVQHIPKSAVDAGNRNGGNPLGLESITQQWWTSIMDWTSPEHDELVRGVGIATTRKWKELGQLRASHLPFVYMNDASRDQNPLATYPQANLARLKAIARKYDRTGVFQTLQKEGFLLSKL
ncbi:FAD-binding domain-containing protein, partial [Patellaria atrata CBS 101060]